jgi:hypothetical protein
MSTACPAVIVHVFVPSVIGKEGKVNGPSPTNAPDVNEKVKG